MENILNMLDKWCGHILAVGLVLIVAAFILSFVFRTAWGTWIKRK